VRRRGAYHHFSGIGMTDKTNQPTNQTFAAMFAAEPNPTEGVVIKKYANRRLYNTETSTYVTLGDLCEMAKQERYFVVVDAKTGEDLTRSVLTQIIVEQEGKGSNLLSESFLRRLIRMYGDNMQPFVTPYLEHVMRGFLTNVDEVRNYTPQGVGGLFNFDQIEALSKQNVEFYDRMMQFFSPFTSKDAAAPSANKPMRSADQAADKRALAADELQVLQRLEDKINDLQHQLENLQKKS
jgi:polyhydroxyalkanoate synthesis repressor PhaR